VDHFVATVVALDLAAGQHGLFDNPEQIVVQDSNFTYSFSMAMDDDDMLECMLNLPDLNLGQPFVLDPGLSNNPCYQQQDRATTVATK
jgi:hypothetical protein